MFLLLSSIPRIGGGGSSPWLPPEPYNPSTGEGLTGKSLDLHEVIVRPRIYGKPKIDPDLLKQISDLLWKGHKVMIDLDLLEEILEDLLEGSRKKQKLKVAPELLKEILESLKTKGT